RPWPSLGERALRHPHALLAAGAFLRLGPFLDPWPLRRGAAVALAGGLPLSDALARFWAEDGGGLEHRPRAKRAELPFRLSRRQGRARDGRGAAGGRG